jgi:iron complex transport system ATP-binding protein
LTTELLADVYRVRASVRPHPDTGRPQVNYDPGVGTRDFAGGGLVG